MPSAAFTGAAVGGLAVVSTAVVSGAVGSNGDDIFTGIVIASFWLSGIVASAARPRSRAAVLLMATGVVGECFIAVDVVANDRGTPGWGLAARVLQCLTFACWLATMASYPADRSDRWSRTTVAVVGLFAVVLPLWWYAAQVAGPLPLGAAYQVLFASPLIGLVLLTRTYRRSGPDQRRQVRWLLLGMVSAAVFYTFSVTPLNDFVPPVLDAVLFAVVTGFVAVSAAIGLVRPTIVDVDLVIRRFPVWVTLWTLITALYASVTGLLSLGAGQHLPVPWAVVLTVVSAMLFQPLRMRLERLADRAVFGRRLDGYDILRDLGLSLEASSQLGEVAQAITEAIAAGVDASWVRLVSSRQSGARRLEVYGVVGSPAGASAMQVPVVHAGRVVGMLECGSRRTGTYTDADREIVTSVARQAAIAVLNVQRAADVSASRRRLVDAADSERARIERDLHDGVQQHLVALMAAVETARNTADPAVAATALDSARQIGVGAMSELRSVIAGILPPVLADRGLVAAVRARGGQLPVPVRVEVPPEGLPRFGRETENAAYFFVSEALVNVVRHAQATSACVRLWVDEGHLDLMVRDDGRGMSPGVVWRGLQGLQDRFAALDGAIQVMSAEHTGSVVSGRLPL